MPTVQVRNIPEDVHRVLKHRAVDAGQSLQEYLRQQLIRQAQQPTLEELFAEIERDCSGGRLSAADAVEIIRADRDERSGS